MNLISEIEAIVARERASGDDGDPIGARVRVQNAISELLGIDTWEFPWFEYEIAVGVHTSIDVEAEILAWLRPLEIAAAPEIAAIIPFRTNSVLVRRYWACPGERLLVPEPTSKATWPEAARFRFRRDMGRLVEHGRVHPWARGFAHMYVSETSETILLNAWAVVKPGTSEEQADFLESIDFQLERRT